MFCNHNLSTYEGYPHGVICRCGLIIHMSDDEVVKPVMHVICPHCGHVTAYLTSKKAAALIFYKEVNDGHNECNCTKTDF